MAEKQEQGQAIAEKWEQGQDMAEKWEQGQDMAEKQDQGQDMAEKWEQGQDMAEKREQGQDMVEKQDQGQDMAKKQEQGQDMAEKWEQGQDMAEKKEQDEGLLVLGAGFSRTGTTSVRSALEFLLSGPCYHGAIVVGERHDHLHAWAEAFSTGRLEERVAKDLLRGCRAAVDWPVCCWYKELLQVYPKAKVGHVSTSRHTFPGAADRTGPKEVVRQRFRNCIDLGLFCV